MLLGLSVAVVASLIFSGYLAFLSRTPLGVATFWPANALLVAGLITLSGARREGATALAARMEMAAVRPAVPFSSFPAAGK
jgi:hypothetical protein